ncbi:MAG: enoyl-CoA hydratase/isomerase family protein [Bacteroidales bacterium]|nr:enoyl-CoA hydratase/isomerase family protein [Bacteroidales bacterium]
MIRGRGSSFCSGVDLNWMKEVSKYNFDQNFLESKTLARCLDAINISPKVVVSLVHGSVMGGANGIVAASDIVISANNTRFKFSEVSLGLVPAVISPYIVKKMGNSNARRLMLMAEEFNASEAERLGLVHYVVEESLAEAKLLEIIRKFLKNSPEAIQSTKLLLQKIGELNDSDNLINYTSEVIARARISDDGQEGMNAYFNKLKPGWFDSFEKNHYPLN